MADRKISDLTALTTPATGDLIPIVDISEAAAADKNKSITVGELLRGAPDGTAAAPGIAFESDGGNGMFLGGTDILAFSTGGTQAVTIDASQRLGIGTSSPGELLTVAGATNPAISIVDTTNNTDARIRTNDNGDLILEADVNQEGAAASRMAFRVDASELMCIQSTGNVGIGVASPGETVDVNTNSASLRLDAASNSKSGNPALKFLNNAGNFSSIFFGDTDDADVGAIQYVHADNSLRVNVNASEAFRVDSSRRLLVGTSTSPTDSINILAKGPVGGGGGSGCVGIGYAGSSGPGSGNTLGVLRFTANNDSTHSEIRARQDGATWTDGSDQPSRLEFSTTADGASSPTERVRINAAGAFKASNSGSYTSTTSTSHEFVNNNTTEEYGVRFNNSATTSNLYVSLFNMSGQSPNNATSVFIACVDSTATRAQIRSNGGLANYQANNVNLSDINSKKDISPAADTWDCIKEWEIVNYRYKDQPDDADLNLGVIAQQVAESCPEVITVFQEAKEATEDQPAQEERLGVKEQQMYWMAIKALQEAQVRIETLEAEVAALKAQ